MLGLPIHFCSCMVWEERGMVVREEREGEEGALLTCTTSCRSSISGGTDPLFPPHQFGQLCCLSGRLAAK